MGIPTVLPGVPPPDTNIDSRIILGGFDLGQPLTTDYGRVTFSGIDLRGWSGASSTTSGTSPRAYKPGSVPSPYPQDEEKTLTLRMMLQAESPAAMREAWDVLNEVVANDDFVLIRDEWGLRRRMTVRRDGPIPEELFTAAIVKRWSCQLLASDPRKYGEQVSASTGLPFVSGGLVFPVTFPIVFSETSNTGVVSIVNSGRTQSAVKLRIDGPVKAPKVTHIGSGRSLTFGSSYTLPAGNWLDVDLDNRQVLENGIADRSQYVTDRGFFVADKGRNDFAFQADLYDPAAKLTVTTASAWK